MHQNNFLAINYRDILRILQNKTISVKVEIFFLTFWRAMQKPKFKIEKFSANGIAGNQLVLAYCSLKHRELTVEFYIYN